MLTNFDKASTLPPGPERERLLTFVVVGGGFAGIEVFAELRSFASSLLEYYPQITFDDTHFHLIEAMGRIMPEVSLETSHWVIKHLAQRGAEIHLDTQLTSAVDGKIELSTGETFETDLIVWTAGVMANPAIVRSSDLPVEERGRLQTRADLRVGDEDDFVRRRLGRRRHRRGPRPLGRRRRRLLRAERPARRAPGQAAREEHRRGAARRGAARSTSTRTSVPSPASASASGVFQSGKLAIKGLLAWFAHRGYHGLAMPSWERKFRVFWGWWNNFWLGRDIVGLPAAAAAARPVRGVRRPPEARGLGARAGARRGIRCRCAEGREGQGRSRPKPSPPTRRRPTRSPSPRSSPSFDLESGVAARTARPRRIRASPRARG